MIGLFPEIERAWLTIDSDIYVWRFGDCQDLAYFDGLSDTILSVGLVPPKPNIFKVTQLLDFFSKFKKSSWFFHAGTRQAFVVPDDSG